MEKEILNFATSKGYVANHVEKLILNSGKNVYALSLLDKLGMKIPTGLPVFVVENYGKLSIVDGEDALSLLDQVK